MCLIAPWIAAFYSQPMLTPLTRALSVTFVINSFGLIQITILIKQINLKTQTKVSANRPFGSCYLMSSLFLVSRKSVFSCWPIIMRACIFMKNAYS